MADQPANRVLVRKRLKEFIVPEQVRKSMNEARDRELGESMKQHGQLQPVGSHSDGTLRWGFRRWHGATLVGLEWLDTIITDDDLTESQIVVLQLTENMQRENLAGWEIYDACLGILQRNPGMKLKDLAKQLNRKPALLTRIMSVSRCIPAAREALKDGKIGISDCYAISKVPEDEQVKLLEMKLNGASRDDLERHRRKRNGKKSGKANRVPQAKCELPGGASVVVTAPSLSMAVICEMLADALKAARKGCDEGQSPSTWTAVMRDKVRSAQHPSADV